MLAVVPSGVPHNVHGEMSGCTARCSTSTRPPDGCKCACGGAAHGSTANGRIPAVSPRGIIAMPPPRHARIQGREFATEASTPAPLAVDPVRAASRGAITRAQAEMMLDLVDMNGPDVRLRRHGSLLAIRQGDRSALIDADGQQMLEVSGMMPAADVPTLRLPPAALGRVVEASRERTLCAPPQAGHPMTLHLTAAERERVITSAARASSAWPLQAIGGSARAWETLVVIQPDSGETIVERWPDRHAAARRLLRLTGGSASMRPLREAGTAVS